MLVNTLKTATKLRENGFSKEQAEVLVDIITDRDSDIATQADIKVLRAEIHEVRTEVREVRTELKGEIQEVRGEIQELRTELKGEIQEVRGEIQEVRTEMKSMRGSIGTLRWLFGFLVAFSVANVGGIIALLIMFLGQTL